MAEPVYFNGGNSTVGLLTVAFVVLKLVGVVNWSWWWVLSPVWISFCIFLLLGFFVASSTRFKL